VSPLTLSLSPVGRGGKGADAISFAALLKTKLPHSSKNWKIFKNRGNGVDFTGIL
jgi:hypothetical protein